MDKKVKVFIAGPYSDFPEGNTERAIRVFHLLLDLDFVPFCPHLTHYADKIQGRPYEEWCEYDLQWLVVCDALYRISGDSKGADNEVKVAQELGIPVFTEIDELERYWS